MGGDLYAFVQRDCYFNECIIREKHLFWILEKIKEENVEKSVGYGLKDRIEWAVKKIIEIKITGGWKW